MASTEISVRKKALNVVENQNITALISQLLSNPVVEIVAGYLAIEWAQRKIVSYTAWEVDPILGAPHAVIQANPLIPPLAGSVAEAGLIVAVALQQGGAPVLSKIFEGGADVMKMGLGIVPNVLKTALTAVAK
jgi:hypothetical protein